MDYLILCIPSRKLSLVTAKNETEVHVASFSTFESKYTTLAGNTGTRAFMADSTWLADAYRIQKAAAKFTQANDSPRSSLQKLPTAALSILPSFGLAPLSSGSSLFFIVQAQGVTLPRFLPSQVVN